MNPHWIQAYNFYQFQADRISEDEYQQMSDRQKLAIAEEALSVGSLVYRDAVREERDLLQIRLGIRPVPGQLPLALEL